MDEVESAKFLNNNCLKKLHYKADVNLENSLIISGFYKT